MLRTIESGDLADFTELLDGKATLDQLRSRGIRTDVVRILQCDKNRQQRGQSGPPAPIGHERGTDAAAKAGLMSGQHWNNIEASDGQIVTLATLEKIAKALGVKAKDLLKGRSSKTYAKFRPRPLPVDRCGL